MIVNIVRLVLIVDWPKIGICSINIEEVMVFDYPAIYGSNADWFIWGNL